MDPAASKAIDVLPEAEILPCGDIFLILSPGPNGRSPLAPRCFELKDRLAVPTGTATETMMRDGASKLEQSHLSVPGTREPGNFTHQHADAIVWLTLES